MLWLAAAFDCVWFLCTDANKVFTLEWKSNNVRTHILVWMLTLAKETFIRRQTFTSGVEAKGFIKKLIKKGFVEGEEGWVARGNMECLGRREKYFSFFTDSISFNFIHFKL